MTREELIAKLEAAGAGGGVQMTPMDWITTAASYYMAAVGLIFLCWVAFTIILAVWRVAIGSNVR